jgi:hypothetical protein
MSCDLQSVHFVAPHWIILDSYVLRTSVVKVSGYLKHAQKIKFQDISLDSKLLGFQTTVYRDTEKFRELLLAVINITLHCTTWYN